MLSKNIKFNIPIIYEGKEVFEISLPEETHVETCVILRGEKSELKVPVKLDSDDIEKILKK